MDRDRERKSFPDEFLLDFKWSYNPTRCGITPGIWDLGDPPSWVPTTRGGSLTFQDATSQREKRQ